MIPLDGQFWGGPMTGAKLAALTLKLSQTPPTVVERVAKIFRDFQSRK